MAPVFPHLSQGEVLWDSGSALLDLRLRGFHPLRRAVSGHFGFVKVEEARPEHYIPRRFPSGVRFGLFPFRSPLIRESLLVSLPPPTEMFPFGGFPLPCRSIAGALRPSRWEVPLGYPRIEGYLRLPEAYRSLLRPSSAS
jgi:hypothetical protein